MSKYETKSNFISGFLVFLIALPLCLGIAKASNFPPIAGIYTAIIGGLLVTFFSKAPLTIKGPAAGLIVIAVGAVEELGRGDLLLGYKLTLAVIVVSGLVQILMGFLKFGKLGDLFPISVIRGMLAAIGVIIVSKQIHVLLGVLPSASTSFALLGEIPRSILNLNPKVAIIGIISLLLLFAHPFFKNKTIKKFPAPLLVLFIAIPLGFLLNLSNEHSYTLGSFDYRIDPSVLLVALPDSFLSGLTFPDFSKLLTYTSIKYIIMFALVGSIESVLSAKAVDSLDPKGRETNLNQDLLAVGIGNTIAGLIGGLPMISEIVRSSANINAGAKSRMSNFYHGLFLLLFVLLAASIIKAIPNAALAAMLVYTGYKLAAPKELKRIRSIGSDQLLLFTTTLVVTLLTDLLIGVAAGIAMKVSMEILSGVSLREMFKLKTQLSVGQEGLVIKIKGIASFINYLKFKSLIDAQAKNQKIVLDFSEASFIDHTFLNNINSLQNRFSKEGGELIKQGFENHHFSSRHHLASRRRITNPYRKSTPSIPLSKRALGLEELAKRYHLEFEPHLSPSFVRPHLSAFPILSRLQRASNFLIGVKEHYSFMVCDIVYSSAENYPTETNTGTIALIFNIAKGGVPDFCIQGSSDIFDLISQSNFEYVHKSKHIPFPIYGANELLIKSFFTEKISQLISSHPYSIECQRRVILIHDDWSPITEDASFENLINYIQNLGDEVVKKRLTEKQKASLQSFSD